MATQAERNFAIFARLSSHLGAGLGSERRPTGLRAPLSGSAGQPLWFCLLLASIPEVKVAAASMPPVLTTEVSSGLVVIFFGSLLGTSLEVFKDC